MRRRVAGGCLAGLMLVVAACGGGGGSKKAASISSGSNATAAKATGTSDDVFTAVNTFGTGGETSVTLSLFGSAADFDALSPSSTTAAKDLKLADKFISNSSVVIDAERGSTASATKFDLAVNLAGESKAIDLLVLNQLLYLRADIKGISQAAGTDTSKLQQQASGLQAQLPFIGALLSGGYISLDLKQLGALSKQLGGSAAAPTTRPAVSKSQVDQAITAIQAALKSNSSVTKVGSDSSGTHYQLSVDPKGFVDAAQAQATALAGPAAAALGSVNKSVSKVPSKPVVIDAWVNGAKLTKVEIDFRQFHQGAGGPTNPLGLRAVFGSAGSISAPSGATPVDLTKLSSMLGGLVGGLGGSTTTSTP